MTAKEYLEQVYRLDREINTKLEEIETLRSMTGKVTGSYEGETVSHSRNVHSLENIIIKLMEAENSLNGEISRLVDLKTEVKALLEKVENDSYRQILIKRYLCYLPWSRISYEMHYSRRWTLTKHERALEVVQKIMKQEGIQE